MMRTLPQLLAAIALVLCATVSGLNPLPGITYAGLGVILETDELGLPVVPLEYHGAYIVNPYDGQKYAVPSAIPANGISTSQTFYRYSTEVYNKTEQSIIAQSKSSGFGFNIPNVIAFSRSKETMKVREVLKQSGMFFGLTAEGHTYFRIRMKPAPLLKIDDDLERMFKYVNYTFNSDTRDAWFDIFSYWGSHYISEFELGGWVEMESHINTKRLRTVNIDYIKTQLSFSFGAQSTPDSSAPFTPGSDSDPANGIKPDFPVPVVDPEDPQPPIETIPVVKPQLFDGLPPIPFGFSFSQAKAYYNKQLDDVFTSSTNITTRCVPACADPTNWRDSWIPHVLKNPQIVTKKLEPITKLFQGQTKLVNTWNQAYQAYIKAVLSGERGFMALPRTQLAREIITERLGPEALVRLANKGNLY